jgi:predicted aspartyl protease
VKHKHFRPAQHGQLLVVRAAVGDGCGTAVVLRLLVDTGSSHTVLPVEVVEAVGCDTHHALDHVRIVSAQGVIVAPRVRAPWRQCLGEKVDGFPVGAHTLPSGTTVDGLLGMDFLGFRRAVINVEKRTIICPVAR